MMNKQRWNLKSSGLLLVCCLISFADPGTTLAKKQTVMKQTDFGTGVKTAVSLIEYHDTCVWVQVFFIADQFFKGIHETETSSGPEFSKDKTLIRTFPDHLVVDVEATVSRCTPHPNEIIPPDYASGLIRGRLEGRSADAARATVVYGRASQAGAAVGLFLSTSIARCSSF